MARGSGRWATIALLALFGAGLVGCSNDGGSTVDTADGDQQTSGSAEEAADEATAQEVLQPPGSPIVEGLVVPDGAHLAGEVFREPFWGSSGGGAIPFPPEAEVWTAYLVVDDDPFAVFDDVAAQLRAGPAPQMPGAADGCLWIAPWPESTAPRGESAVATDPTTDPSPVEVPDERAEVRRRLLSSPQPLTGSPERSARRGHRDRPKRRTARPPPPDARSTSRSARTTRSVGRHRDRFVVRAAHALRPGHRVRQLPPPPGPGPGPGPVERTARPRPSSFRCVGAPAAATTGRAAVPGDRFGTEANCFAGRGYGYQQFRLPEGAAVVADRIGGAQSTLLVADDAATALADLRDQMERDPADEMSSPHLDEQTVSTGERVVRYSHSVLAGGGACDITVAPGGRLLRIDRHSD